MATEPGPFPLRRAKVEIVTALIAPVAAPYRNLSSESAVSMVLVEVQHGINPHRVDEIVSVVCTVKPDNPIALLRLDAHVIRHARGKCAPSMKRIRRETVVVDDDVRIKLQTFRPSIRHRP